MYFVMHSSQLIVIHCLSCNESLCTGIKAKGPISSKVADNHQFKKIHQLYKKKFFHKTTFLPAFAFIHGNLSRGNNIKNNQASLCRLSNSLLNSLPLEKLIQGNSIYGNLKLYFQL